MTTEKTFYSDRGIPLVFRWTEPGPRTVPWLTVEHWCKWYSLFLVHPDDRVEVVYFGDLEPHRGRDSAYLDHTPNPWAVERLCEAKGWELDDIAREVMHGRWFLATCDWA